MLLTYLLTFSVGFKYDVCALIQEGMSNYIHHKAWDEIKYPFLNFSGATVEV